MIPKTIANKTIAAFGLTAFVDVNNRGFIS